MENFVIPPVFPLANCHVSDNVFPPNKADTAESLLEIAASTKLHRSIQGKSFNFQAADANDAAWLGAEFVANYLRFTYAPNFGDVSQPEVTNILAFLVEISAANDSPLPGMEFNMVAYSTLGLRSTSSPATRIPNYTRSINVRPSSGTGGSASFLVFPKINNVLPTLDGLNGIVTGYTSTNEGPIAPIRMSTNEVQRIAMVFNVEATVASATVEPIWGGPNALLRISEQLETVNALINE
jgi:hypothetical protein